MQVNEVFDMARALTYIAGDGPTDNTLLPYLNIVYHEMENEIVQKVDEDFFYEIFKADLIAGQSEYTMETSSATQNGMKKILQVSVIREPTENTAWTSAISYDVGDKVSYLGSDYQCITAHTSLSVFQPENWRQQDYYNVLPRAESSSYAQSNMGSYSRDRLRDAYSNTSGFYDIKDSSLFIYPMPRYDITNGIKVSAIVNQTDLVVGGAESTIFPQHTELRQHHYMLAIGLKQYIFSILGKVQEAQMANQEREMEKRKLVQHLTDRTYTPLEEVLPSGDYLKI